MVAIAIATARLGHLYDWSALMEDPLVSPPPAAWQESDLGSPRVAMQCLGLGAIALIACCWLFQAIGTVTPTAIAVQQSTLSTMNR